MNLFKNPFKRRAPLPITRQIAQDLTAHEIAVEITRGRIIRYDEHEGFVHCEVEVSHGLKIQASWVDEPFDVKNPLISADGETLHFDASNTKLIIEVMGLKAGKGLKFLEFIETDETRQAAAVLANDPNAREAITLGILGTKVDHAPGVDWSCHRAWSINRVRRLVQQALTDLSSAPSANPHSKHLEKPMAQSTTLPIDMKGRRFTVGECAGDTFETQGDYFGYAVTIEVKSKEEADAIQEILTKQRNAS